MLYIKGYISKVIYQRLYIKGYISKVIYQRLYIKCYISKVIYQRLYIKGYIIIRLIYHKDKQLAESIATNETLKNDSII